MDWTKDLSLQLRKLHSQHLVTSAIAEMMNLPVKEVTDKLFKFGLKENESSKPEPSQFATKQSIPQDRTKIRPQIFNPEMDKQIGGCLEQRMSNQEIADKLGVTYQQLASRMSLLRKTGRLTVPANRAPKDITPIAEAESKSNLRHDENPAKNTEVVKVDSVPAVDNSIDNSISMPDAMCLLLKFIRDTYTSNVTECSASTIDGIAYAEFEFEGTSYDIAITVLKKEPALVAAGTSSNVNISPTV